MRCFVRRLLQMLTTTVLVCALAASAWAAVTEAQVATLTMTGDVEKDFGSKAGVITEKDPGEIDVGLPPGGAFANLISGWDIKVNTLHEHTNNEISAHKKN